MNVFEFKDFIFASFIGASAWFSYKLGWRRGLEYGVDESIDLLADAGLIELEKLEDGDVKIHKAK